MDGLTHWIAQRAGVHPITVWRWRQRKRIPPAVERLMELELRGDLGLIDPAWEHWRLERSRGIVSPGGDIYRPGDLLALTLTRQRLRALEEDLARYWEERPHAQMAHHHHADRIARATRAGDRARAQRAVPVADL